MANRKISQLPSIEALTGSEVLPVMTQGITYGVQLSKLFQIISLKEIGLDQVDNVADKDKPVSDATLAALEGKANKSHIHDIRSIGNLETALEAKAEAKHTHVAADITDLDAHIETKISAMKITVTMDTPEW